MKNARGQWISKHVTAMEAVHVTGLKYF